MNSFIQIFLLNSMIKVPKVPCEKTNGNQVLVNYER